MHKIDQNKGKKGIPDCFQALEELMEIPDSPHLYSSYKIQKKTNKNNIIKSSCLPGALIYGS